MKITLPLILFAVTAAAAPVQVEVEERGCWFWCAPTTTKMTATPKPTTVRTTATPKPVTTTTPPPAPTTTSRSAVVWPTKPPVVPGRQFAPSYSNSTNWWVPNTVYQGGGPVQNPQNNDGDVVMFLVDGWAMTYWKDQL